MTVIKFVPPSSPPIAGAKPRGSGGPRAPADSFAAVLTEAAGRGAKNSSQIISLENRRALGPQDLDLGEAGRLLNRLDHDIRKARPELLRQVHQLEGLIQIRRI